MGVWAELTRKRFEHERFVVVGLAMAAVGLTSGVVAVAVFGRPVPPLSVSFVLVGLVVAAFAFILGRQKR